MVTEGTIQTTQKILSKFPECCAYVNIDEMPTSPGRGVETKQCGHEGEDRGRHSCQIKSLVRWMVGL